MRNSKMAWPSFRLAARQPFQSLSRNSAPLQPVSLVESTFHSFYQFLFRQGRLTIFLPTQDMGQAGRGDSLQDRAIHGKETSHLFAIGNPRNLGQPHTQRPVVMGRPRRRPPCPGQKDSHTGARFWRFGRQRAVPAQLAVCFLPCCLKHLGIRRKTETGGTAQPQHRCERHRCIK